MYTRVKTQQEIDDMRISGGMLATVLNVLRQRVQAGMSTKDLAAIAAEELVSLGGKPAFLGYQGFPDVICISVNNEVVHGIPNEATIIQSGDLVSLDFGVVYNGMITDSAITVGVGDADSADLKLLEVTERAMMAGINTLVPGVRTGTIGNAIEEVLNKHGYGIVRDLVGHGVGHHVHEDPNVPNYGRKNTGDKLDEGMTIAIEPMATRGGHRVYMADDQWTILTQDGSRAAHFEHTILITENGPDILTMVA